MLVPNGAWSSDAKLAAQVWFGMNTASRFALFDRYGKDTTLEIGFAYAHAHHKAHFVDGATKLGLMDLPHPILCARYHAFSNLLGGIDMGYAEEEGRGWVFYLPPNGLVGSLLIPSPAVHAIGPEVMINVFRAWHGYNGVSLGNPRLRFVVTDVFQAGGPYDAGYFEEADKDLTQEQRVVVRLGEEKATAGLLPPIAGDWPQARRDKALAKYCAEYSIVALAEVASRWGLEDAAAIAEVAHRAVFVQWARVLVDRLGIEEHETVAETAEVFRRSFELLGDEITRADEGGVTYLHHNRSRLCAPHYQWDVLPRAIEEAFARAWSVVSRSLGNEVQVTVAKSRSDGAAATVWRFAPAA